jgi:hypothetical protein
MSLSSIIHSMEEAFSFHKDVNISGFKFELTILNYEKDQMISAFSLNNEDPLAFYEKTRMSILSHAITKISDEKIPDIVEEDIGDKIITKERPIYLRDLLKRMPPKIVEKLFDIYIDFKDEVDNKLDKDIEYKWYKTPEQREKERLKEKEKDQEKLNEEEFDIEKVGEGFDIEKVDEEEPIVFKKIEEKDEDNNK